MKRFTCAILCLTLIFTFTACSGKAVESNKKSDVITIGVICPLTGESTIYGDVLAKTVQLLVNETNANGGILGKQIVLKSYDNRDDAVETTNAARKAILNDGVVAFIGTDSSTSTIALVEVATEYEIPVVTSIATNSKVTMTDDGKVRPYAFRACLSDPQSGSIMGEYVVNELNYKNLAIIYEIGSDFSIGITNEFSESVEANGGTVTTKEAYNTGDVDFRAVLTKIKNSKNFDAIYIAAGYYKQIGLIANQARDLGITQPFITTEGAMSSDIFNIASNSIENMVFNVAVDTESPNVKPLIEKFVAEYNYDPSVNVAADCFLAYDAYKLLEGAIEKAGVVDSNAIRDALESTTDLKGLTSNISFVPETHVVIREVPICKIENGGFITIGLFEPSK
ncbi:MAG: ABC transporter substrate-binding protein [Lutispora sp.]|nr:ABC transporter substrate-binding protein [Lutispora sp.]